MGSPVFTPSVLAAQKAFGSRVGALSFPAVLTPTLMDFVSKRNSAYLATANAAGLPTVQHRGGSPGFIRKVDGHTIGFADFRGNGQLISYGNIGENPQACLFLMDYENRWRVKIWGEARIDTSLELLTRLTPESCSGKAKCLVEGHRVGRQLLQAHTGQDRRYAGERTHRRLGSTDLDA